MINKILNVPDYLDIKHLKKDSQLMKKYLNDNIIDQLRNAYKTDIKEFQNVLKEINFRGISFNQEYQNNFLKGIDYEIKEIIKTDSDEKKFLEIDFKTFGLGDFITNFRIKKDSFFNFIPLAGLNTLIPPFKQKLFRDELLRCGFSLEILNESKQHLEKNSKKNNKNKIEDFYTSHYYRHFLNFCNQKGLTYIYEIDNEVIEDYSKFKGTRKNTYLRVLKKYNELVDGNSYLFEKGEPFFNNKISEFLNRHGADYRKFLNNYFKESSSKIEETVALQIEEWDRLLEGLEIDYELMMEERVKKTRILREHDTYKDIKNIPINIFLFQFDTVNLFHNESRKISELSIFSIDKIIIEKIIKIIYKKKSMLSYWRNFQDNLTPNEKKVLTLRSNDQTLQNIGGLLGVSRERVRQIEKKVSKKFINDLNYDFFIKLLNLYMKKYHYLDREFFECITTNEEEVNELLHLLRKTFEYIVLTNTEVLTTTDKLEELQTIVENKKERDIVIYAEEFQNYDDKEVEIIYILLIKNGFYYHDNKFIKGKITISERLEYLLREKIGYPIKNDPETFEKMKKKLKSYFNYEVESSQRGFFTRVDETKNVLLVDKNTYMYQTLEDVDLNFLNLIQGRIDFHISNSTFADPKEIYEENIDLMTKNNIISYTHLYSLIKVFFSEEYNVGYLNTLRIYPLKMKIISPEKTLVTYLNDNNHVKYKDVLTDLNWKNYKLDQVLSKIDYVVINSNRTLIDLRGIKDEGKYSDLIMLVRNELKKDYLFTSDLLFELFADEEINKLLTKYHLMDVVALSNFIKKTFENVKNGWQFLYIADKNIDGIETIIPDFFDILVDKNQVSDYLKSKGYSPQTIYLIIDNLKDVELFVPFEKNIFRNMRKAPLSSKNIDLINKELNAYLIDNLYMTTRELEYILSLNELKDPYLTPQVLAFIVEEQGYKLLEAYDGSKYDLPIIIKENSKINSYEELVYYLIDTESDMTFSSANLLRFLKTKHLASRNASDVYMKIKNSVLFEFDELGTFKLL